ncbi:cisplatin damage response ATP-dependent DNA ligase [Legionella hackeliae]|uniref:DNA ligase (ATP) n=1 Tax=Legionella hackeliae TaxID=449 RepID=A0A0A8UP58_LEGHA|nr:cisplatin damage response ATP-dependent DNA ligase [Legionella hackeliae]KTD13832.1 ATP dependent DNA ligase [Legionella hackeliae]CEK10533.1 ATP dependent DNA ligase [Legionella hackeliae]STX47271.1 Putative DNA ligase-like protein Rv0938/MT0965 [Legionella hackeliae]
MKTFSQLLNNLYFSYSHHAKLRLLQDFFATTQDPERGYAIAILADTLEFPTFKRALIRGLIEKRIDPYLFALSNDYVGDVSETLALAWPSSTTMQSSLPSLTKVIHQLKKTPPNQMAASLAELLDNSNAIERWALLKLGTGSLRVGVSARFVKHALAKYGNVDIKDIEHVWHALEPPYVELFAWLEGKQAAPEISNAVFFHPVMLSHPLKEKDLPLITEDTFFAEHKYDGIRVQFVSSTQEKALYSRTGDNISVSFPDVVSEINTPVVLDGELVVLNQTNIGSFNDLQQRLNRKKLSDKILKEQPAAIILYDILKMETDDLRTLPLYERRQLLEAWYARHRPKNMWLSELLSFSNLNGLLELKETVLAKQHVAVEGLMLKRKDSPYIAGRPVGHWYKWKRDPHLIDAVLMYAQRGHGKRSSFYSDYTFGLWQNDKLLPVGKAYFGFTDEELYQLDKWIRYHTQHRFGPVREVEKTLVFEVAFDAVNFSSRHKSGVALRFPRIHRIRWDKPANEADSLDTLVALIK